MKLNLTLACNLYDRTVALQNGSVAPQGIDLNFLELNVKDIFTRQALYAEFDVSEMSVAQYAILRGRGDHRLIAIPVFPSRKFRHSGIFINTNSGIKNPGDLVGKRIGSTEYQQTSTVWQKGLLQDEYGVSPDQMEWYLGPMDKPDPEYSESLPLQLPDNIRYVRIKSDQCLDKMLCEGEIDAAMCSFDPVSFRRGSPKIARLFPNYLTVETEYYRNTNIFPIMHTVVIKRSIYEKAPWVAASMYDAFVKAKSDALKRQHHTGTLFSMIPWVGSYLEDQRQLMGEDPFIYGLGKQNEKILGKLLQYTLEQRLIAKVPIVKELFAQETHGLTKG